MQTYNRAVFGNIANPRDCTSAKSYSARRARGQVKQQAEPWSRHGIWFFSAAVFLSGSGDAAAASGPTRCGPSRVFAVPDRRNTHSMS